MARSVRGCLIPWPQGGAEEAETNPSAPQQEQQRDTREGKVIAYYNLDLHYKPEGSNPDIKAVNEEEENFDAEYAKLPQDGTLHQRTMNCKVAGRIKQVCWVQGPEIMVLCLQDMHLQL